MGSSLLHMRTRLRKKLSDTVEGFRIQFLLGSYSRCISCYAVHIMQVTPTGHIDRAKRSRGQNRLQIDQQLVEGLGIHMGGVHLRPCLQE